MRRILIALLVLTGVWFLSSCEDVTEPVNTTGKLFVTSRPAGAKIYVNEEFSGKFTPDTITAEEGIVKITLTKDGYMDTTVSISITANQTGVLSVELKPIHVKYGPVKLWETIGTTAEQPSGLDLSSGNAYGISSDDKDKVDIYYSSDGFLVRSADYKSTLHRVTYFRTGDGTDLNDGTDSPAVSDSWAKSMGDRETHYVFLYDDDGHYSKIKIVNYGGGTPGEPAWIEVEWIYNKVRNNVSF